MKFSEDNQVLIAGAGPVGLLGAALLAAQGIPVTVLEAEPALTIDLRAGTFHPPSLELMSPLGVSEDLVAIGIKVPIWQYRDLEEGIVATFDLGLLADVTPFPYRLHCEQHKLTAIVLDRLIAGTGVAVHFDHKVVGVEQNDDRVRVDVATPDGPRRFEGAYLIGADGGRSSVRKLAGFRFNGFTWPELFVVISTYYDFGEDGIAPNAYIADPADWCAFFKMPGGERGPLWRFAYGADPALSDEAVLGDRAVQARIRRFLGRSETHELAYRSTYRVHQRVAETFRIGRVLLAGDAAHLNNPIGALGLNSGIQDIANLAQKLGAVMRGEAESTLLDRYVRQRRTIAEEFVQAMSIRNKTLLQERDPAVRRRNLDEIRRTAEDPARAREFLLKTSMIDSMRRAEAIA